MRALTIIALAALMLAGCGQKGPLYLPADSEGDNAAAVSDQQSNDMSNDANNRAGDTAPANAEDES
nr:lipoprotein [Halomonas salinarum]